jgi:hypothetical protein
VHSEDLYLILITVYDIEMVLNLRMSGCFKKLKILFENENGKLRDGQANGRIILNCNLSRFREREQEYTGL